MTSDVCSKSNLWAAETQTTICVNRTPLLKGSP